MKQWTRVRQKVLRDQQSKRSVMREEGLYWESLEKMLAYSRPPGTVSGLSRLIPGICGSPASTVQLEMRIVALIDEQGVFERINVSRTRPTTWPGSRFL